MKKILCFILIIASPFLLANEYQKFDRTKHNFEDGGRWTGSLSLDETVIHANGVVNGKSEKHVRVAFLDALPASNGNYDSADNKGTGTYSIQGESTMIGGQKCSMDCQGGGLAILNAVNINEEANTYDIDAIGPDCNGTKTCTGEGTKPYGPDGDDEITVSDQHLLDKDVLSGTVSTSAELPNGLGTITKTITWHLVRSKATDVELIVTPADYDTWLPEPGKNELNKGSVMTINLKLQGKNGKPFQEKAESFELRLSNTSKDTGITINYPISPDAKQLPDLRFLMHPGIESIEEDQFISVGSSDGLTGKALIASYDGGGWTTLTVEAILKDKRHIRGSLLVSNGETDIRIPKRDPNSKIAKAWLKANGNPGDMDDREATTGNINDGDGLTAYEEYRGVIAITKVQGSFKEKFRRLDPKKKELGVLVKRKQFPLFSEGIDWLENATGLEVIRFDETE
ncbi:MAG: hypothetical protein ABIR78_05995, partial [Ferruginibacter sp.]